MTARSAVRNRTNHAIFIAIGLSLLGATGCLREAARTDVQTEPSPRASDGTPSGTRAGHPAISKNCRMCHEKDRPKAVNHNATDDCSKCHTSGTFWLDLTFHKQALAQGSCSGCHDSARPTTSITRTSTGPVALQTTIDATHFTAIQPGAQGLAGRDCFHCHQVLTPQNRDTHFEFLHRNALGVVFSSGCRACHTTPPALAISGNPHPSIQTKDCSECHSQAGVSWQFRSPHDSAEENTALTQPENPEAGCLSCHEGWRRTAALNRLAVPQVEPSPAPLPQATPFIINHHFVLDCIECHAPRVKAEDSFKTSFSHAANPAYFAGSGNTRAFPACTVCHGPMRPGYEVTITGTAHKLRHPQLTSSGVMQCSNCHKPDDARSARADQLAAWRDRTGKKFSHWNATSGKPVAQCVECHEPRRPASHTTKTGTPMQTAECATCHTRAVLGASWGQGADHSGATACTICHASDRPGTPVPLSPATPTFTRFDHAFSGVTADDCDTCHHAPGAQWSGAKFGTPHSPLPNSCAPCHSRPAGHKTVTADCATCHLAGKSGQLLGWKIHNPLPATCASCHLSKKPAAPVAVSPATISSARFDHSATVLGTSDCAKCHRYAGVSWSGAKFGTPHSPLPIACSSCHSKPAGHKITTAECKTCHGNGATGQPLGWKVHTPGTNSCNNCHMSKRPTTTINGFNHSGSCGRCHPGYHMDFDCSRCHYSPGSSWVTTPAGIPRDGGDCNWCHYNGGPFTG